jgi:hypothetical protein
VTRIAPLFLVSGLTLGALPLACGTDRVKSPFGPSAGGAGAGGEGPQGDAGLMIVSDAGDPVDPTLGGPCHDDGQCHDAVDCTRDYCDLELGRCRFEPDDGSCRSSFCGGQERCDVRLGCVPGDIVSCSDGSTCTIDVCDEATQSCRHEPRDADGDGDPTHNCGGGDCDDTDPSVSSLTSEVCGNQRDDDCDGEIDESDCATPDYDTCDSTLEVTEPGYFDLDLTATKLDYPNECATEAAGFRDAVLEVVLPEGGPYDLDVTAKLDSHLLALGTEAACGGGGQVSCVPSYVSPVGASVARLLLRGLEPGRYPVYVAADTEATAQLRVDWRPAEAERGELCEDAVALTPNGSALTLRLADYQIDSESICDPEQPTPDPDSPKPVPPTRTGDAFVSFSLAEPQDVVLIAEAQNGLGVPLLSLRDASCKTELTCRRSQPGRLFVRALPAGDYVASVASTGPDDVSVRLQTLPVSDAPAAEGCDHAEPLTPGVEQVVDLSTHQDAVNAQCLAGAPDASFSFELDGKRDVALVGRFADGDEGALSFVNPSCDDNHGCSSGGGTLRAVRYGLPTGSYGALIESAQGNPVGISWFERPAAAAVVVPFSDDCSAVVSIPEQGGRFLGNTSNLFADFDAGCDVGGQAEGGAPDQILKLSLSAPRRVILDMIGSAYRTMLSVRRGPSCPGTELPLSCAAGYGATRSFLDLRLQPGDYFVQIDGFAGDSGAWKLDVFTAPL